MASYPIVEQLEGLLSRHDPIGLRAHGAPSDEYRPEANGIASRLHTASSLEDVTRILHEEFAVWFGADIAGDEGQYVDVALELHGLPRARPT